MTKKRLSYDLGADYITTDGGFEDEVVGIPTGLSLANQGDYAKALRAMLEDRLTKKQKCYMILYYRDGLTVKEIAEKCGVDKSTVSRTINRGRQRLSGALGREVMRRIFGR